MRLKFLTLFVVGYSAELPEASQSEHRTALQDLASRSLSLLSGKDPYRDLLDFVRDCPTQDSLNLRSKLCEQSLTNKTQTDSHGSLSTYGLAGCQLTLYLETNRALLEIARPSTPGYSLEPNRLPSSR
jgi:uncharacterized membrane protein